MPNDLTPAQMEHAVTEGVRRFLHEQFDKLFIGYQFAHLIQRGIAEGVKEAVKEARKK